MPIEPEEIGLSGSALDAGADGGTSRRRQATDAAQERGIETKGRRVSDIETDIERSDAAMEDFVKRMDAYQESRNANLEVPAPVQVTEDVVITERKETEQPGLDSTSSSGETAGGAEGDYTLTLLVNVDGGTLTTTEKEVLARDPPA